MKPSRWQAPPRTRPRNKRCSRARRTLPRREAPGPAGRSLASILVPVEERRYDFLRVLARQHGHDLQADTTVPPIQCPLLDQAQVVALHKLKAAVEIRLDPAADIFQPVRRHTAALAEALIDGDGVLVLEALDDHEKHRILHESGEHS